MATASEKTSKLKEVMEKAKKKYGVGFVSRASTARALKIIRLSTGVFALDSATGGGIPLGRFSGLWGEKSSGKTTVALKIVGAAQNYCQKHWFKCEDTDKKLYRCLECGYRGEKEGEDCPDCKSIEIESTLVDMGDKEKVCPKCGKYEPFQTIWLDAEGSWENKWSAAHGINGHHVYVIRPEYAEQAVDMADAMLRTGECDLLVIDTLAHLTPKIEIEETMEKWQMGVQARLLNKMLRKMVSCVNHPGLHKERRPTVIMLNQVRMKIGVMFGSPETKPGGKSQDFDTCLDLKMWRGKYEKDAAGNTMSVTLKFRTEKNKTFPAQQEGDFKMWLRTNGSHRQGDTEEDGVVIGFALREKLFGSSGKWAYDGQKFKLKDDVVSYVLSDRKIFDKVRGQLMDMTLGKIESVKEAVELVDDNDEEDAEEKDE